MAGSIRFPASSLAFEMVNEASMEAMVIQAVSIARCRPGQALVYEKMNEPMNGQVTLGLDVHLRPNPKPPSKSGSGQEGFPLSSLRYRSGRNFQGSG